MPKLPKIEVKKAILDFRLRIADCGFEGSPCF